MGRCKRGCTLGCTYVFTFWRGGGGQFMRSAPLIHQRPVAPKTRRLRMDGGTRRGAVRHGGAPPGESECQLDVVSATAVGPPADRLGSMATRYPARVRGQGLRTRRGRQRGIPSPSQGSKVPIPNRRLVPSSREKRGKTGKNGGKRRKNGEKRGENGGKTGKNGGNLGGGILDKTHPPEFYPPHVYNSVGSIFCKPN